MALATTNSADVKNYQPVLGLIEGSKAPGVKSGKGGQESATDLLNDYKQAIDNAMGNQKFSQYLQDQDPQLNNALQNPSSPAPSIKEIANFFYLVFKFFSKNRDADTQLQVAQAMSMVSREKMLDNVTASEMTQLKTMQAQVAKAKEEANNPLAIILMVILVVVTIVITAVTAGAAAPAAAAVDAGIVAGETTAEVVTEEVVEEAVEESIQESMESGVNSVGDGAGDAGDVAGDAGDVNEVADNADVAQDADVADGASDVDDAGDEAGDVDESEDPDQSENSQLKQNIEQGKADTESLNNLLEDGEGEEGQGAEGAKANSRSMLRTLWEGLKAKPGMSAAILATGGGITAGVGTYLLNKRQSDCTNDMNAATSEEQGNMAVDSSSIADFQNEIKQYMNEQQNEAGNQQGYSSMMQQIISAMLAIYTLGKF
jgi:hypothetical protein